MTVHAGQLSLLDLADAIRDEVAKQPLRGARQAATPADKPPESEAGQHRRRSHKGLSASLSAGDSALLTTDEAADLLHVHPRTVQRLVRRGELSAVHLGSAVRFDPRDVDGLIAR